MTERVPCITCGALVLPSTAAETGGLCMPCKGGYRKNIEAGKRRIEEDKKRRDSPPERFWRSLVERVYHTPAGFDGLTRAEQTYYAIRVLRGEVCNGGFQQYFFDSDHYTLALEGLLEVGATQARTLVLQAKEILFGSQHELPALSARREILLSMLEGNGGESDWSQRLEAVEQRFYEDPDQLDERMGAFARKHLLYAEF
jgi:hypothetical protein